MEIDVFDNCDLLAKKAAKLIVESVKKNPTTLMSFAAGYSQIETYKYLVEHYRKKEVDFSDCTFLGLDEWVGMGKEDEGSCTHFMYEKVFKPLNICDDQIIFFNAKEKQLDEECIRINNYLKKNGPIDLVLLGVGMNGHVGFNEPGISKNLDAHIVDLDKVTKEVGQKYFKKKMKFQKGITLGLNQIIQAKKAIIILNGENKAEILRKITKENDYKKIPAVILKSHDDSVFLVDEKAALLLE